MEQDDDLFPRLVRFEFQIHCTKATEQREGYTALQEEVKTSLAEMKQTFKVHVINATKLKLTTENNKILEEHCKSIRLIVKAFRIGNNNVDNADKIVVYYIQEHGDSLLLPSVKSATNFKRKYIKIHKLSAWPHVELHLSRAHSSQDWD